MFKFKTLGWKFSESLGGETLIFNPSFYPLFCNLKNKPNLKLSSKAKLKPKNKPFGVLSFWSFSTKFKVILKIQISRNCPLFQFESPIQNLFGILKNCQHESCRAQKVEQLSSWELFKLFWKIKSNFEISNLPQFKIGIFPNLRFEFQTVWFNFVPFHLKSVLDP